MIPSSFMTLTKMPLTPNGKIDEKQLPIPVRGQIYNQANEALIVPTTNIQQKLHMIWKNLLAWSDNDRPLTIVDDFFEVGGSSMMLQQLQAAIKSELGINYPIIQLINDKSITDQADYISAIISKKSNSNNAYNLFSISKVIEINSSIKSSSSCSNSSQSNSSILSTSIESIELNNDLLCLDSDTGSDSSNEEDDDLEIWRYSLKK